MFDLASVVVVVVVVVVIVLVLEEEDVDFVVMVMYGVVFCPLSCWELVNGLLESRV